MILQKGLKRKKRKPIEIGSKTHDLNTNTNKTFSLVGIYISFNVHDAVDTLDLM